MFCFACPVCGSMLQRENSCYKCGNGHSFDRAKKGYVNLLLINKSKQKRHGDDSLMIKARESFLKKGYYAPLCDTVCSLAKTHSAAAETILDIGCGEGYYTKALADTFPQADIGGIDISKDALSAAHKNCGGAELAVASVFTLPVMNESVDIVTNIFAPENEAELLRILKPGGIFIKVIPLERHLWELKEKLYEKPYENKVPEISKDGFSVLTREILKYKFTPDRDGLSDLFMMTPYYYKTGREDQQKLQSSEPFEISAEFSVTVYGKLN